MKTICQYILEAKTGVSSVAKGQARSAIAVKYRQKSKLFTRTWLEYYDDILKVSTALSKLGAKKTSKVGIFSNTRYEWSVCDYATFSLGAVTVPVYHSMTTDDLVFIFNHAEIEFLFIENMAGLRSYLKIKEKCPYIKKVILFQGESSEANVIHWNEFMMLGEQDKQVFESQFIENCQSFKPTDIASVIYTSGTSGLPKGVTVLHSQIISEIEDSFPMLGVTPSDRSLTFLPYAHVLGRIEHWGHLYIGFEMTYAESIEKIRQELVQVQPTLMVAVPRIFEKIYGTVMSQMENQAWRTKLFRWAIQVGKQIGECKLKKQSPSARLAVDFLIADRLVLRKIRKAFGGELKFAICGGAPMALDVALFFHACGILILEGYGLSETTAAIAVNTTVDYKFGSVGKPLKDVQIKIAEDGEILVKSKKVTSGYYKDPEATANAFTDGWFHTGDIGEFIDNGHLKITDRKKDLIKTAGGKYVAPQKLENLVKSTSLVSNVLIHGDQRKYIVALVTLDNQQIQKFAKDFGITDTSPESVISNKKIFEEVRKNITFVNSQLASFESIKKFSILPKDFTVEEGELTPSLKLKRKVLDKKYSSQIEALYRGS